MLTTHRSLASNWGTTSTERAMAFPCDSYLAQPDGVYFRAVNIEASASVIFRWLCQLKVAPYSYDLLDNQGRQSPRRLIEGLEQLEVGQKVMTIFKLVAF